MTRGAVLDIRYQTAARRHLRSNDGLEDAGAVIRHQLFRVADTEQTGEQAGQRRPEYGPRTDFQRTDLSVFKNFDFAAHHRIQVRIEAAQPLEPGAVRSAERHVWQRRVRPDHVSRGRPHHSNLGLKYSFEVGSDPFRQNCVPVENSKLRPAPLSFPWYAIPLKGFDPQPAMNRREFLTRTAGGLFAAQAPAVITSDRVRPRIDYGTAAGDPSPGRAIVSGARARGENTTPVTLDRRYATTEAFANARRVTGPIATPETGLTARVAIQGLPAGQDIFYRARFEDPSDPRIVSAPETGRFRTAPEACPSGSPGGLPTPAVRAGASTNRAAA